MKKFLWLMVFSILTIPPVWATSYSANVYASWYSVGGTNTTFTPPIGTRNISIINGDATDAVCVGLEGQTLTNSCTVAGSYSGSVDSVVLLAPSNEINLYDFLGGSITLRQAGAGAASPVSVIATY